MRRRIIFRQFSWRFGERLLSVNFSGPSCELCLFLMAMYRCSIREMLTKKSQNCNGFFTTHRYLPFLNPDEDKEFAFNFCQRREAFINTDRDVLTFRRATWDLPPPPDWQGLFISSQGFSQILKEIFAIKFFEVSNFCLFHCV